MWLFKTQCDDPQTPHDPTVVSESMVVPAPCVESLDQGVLAACPVDGSQQRCKWMKKFMFEWKNIRKKWMDSQLRGRLLIIQGSDVKLTYVIVQSSV
ncbi:hypothetical protein A2U01_0014561 [Trifolium medium]|uniref:Uncharacterized protein n=1 Tax=Trifolium medium TaxID=97028 RepID=A0A392N339_9FABA|nr:hypothetical protein [Trifolium medium]